VLDHPVVVGVLREILESDRSDECYGVRCENSLSVIRRKGRLARMQGTGMAHTATGFTVIAFTVV